MMKRGRLIALLVAVAAALVVAVGSVGAASASTTVNCNAVGGAAAFQAALAAGGTIDVSGTCVGTFTVPSSDRTPLPTTPKLKLAIPPPKP